MKKAPEAFRTISEVASLLDTPAHILRFWESKFYQIKPIKRAGGRRYYRPDDVALLAGIRHLLQGDALTIRGVQRVLQEQGVRHVIALGAQTAHLTNRSDTPDTDDTGEDMADTPVDISADTDSDTTALTTRGTVQAAPPPSGMVPPLTAGDAAAAGTPAPAGPIPVTPAAVTPAAARELVLDAADPSQRQADRIAPRLRGLHRGTLGARRDRLALLARRIDTLLDRMSEASGAGRW